MGWLATHETSTLRLEAATICQLACPSCPTTQGVVKRQLGAGFLGFDDFRRIVDENPWVSEIELSNWGEIFLNPEIERIVAYAYRHSVALTAWNGANLNHVRENVLEDLARYRFRGLTCSIDGVSQATYETYRRKGQVDRVLDNIRRLNAYKRRWKTRYPKLRWQMIAFRHNEHEIPAARALADELGMSFVLKTSWDPELSPGGQAAPEPAPLAPELPAAPATAAAAPPDNPDHQMSDEVCSQLWGQPQINFDGTLLGCCVNTWASFGENAFAVGVARALAAEKLGYAKEMLQGKVPPRDDVPCTTCQTYLWRAREARWLRPPPAQPGVMGFLRRRGMGRAVVWVDNRFGRYLLPIRSALRQR